ncbi:MAG: AN1-type zinc finger domain-containing protein [Candidatus Bathycorpusculaceae bacterium]
MRCQKCGREVFLPFRCPYCGDYFCSEHRLPENHNCPQMELARAPKEETRPTTVQKPHQYSVTYVPVETATKRVHFSSKEIEHLSIAALLVMGIGASFGIYPDIYSKLGSPLMLVLSALVLTVSFLIHEIAHKFAAQKSGLWAEFRLTLFGAALTLLSIISPLFKIISPGAVMIGGFFEWGKVGKISIAGPLTNIVLSVAFLLATLPAPDNFVFLLGFAINAWIAFFNLIPFGILDGFKVFSWNKGVWALAFTTSLVLTIASYMLLPI